MIIDLNLQLMKRNDTHTVYIYTGITKINNFTETVMIDKEQKIEQK